MRRTASNPYSLIPNPPERHFSMRVILLGFGGRPDFLCEAARLEPLINQRAQVVAVDFTGQRDLSNIDADMVIVVGGDGSILRAAHQMGRRQLPVLAVNLGKLGFLADLSADELVDILPTLSADRLSVVEHLMFQCRVFRGEQLSAHELGLNEVAVQHGPPFSLQDVDLYIDSEPVTTYSCDGLIIATPVGSTAHSLSAGGPILRKDLQAFVVSPLAPHTLTHRPVVDSADRVYELVIASAGPGSSVVVDGRTVCAVGVGDRVRIQRAEERFKLVTVPNHSYYRTLREKLGWSGNLSLGGGPPVAVGR
jgi:NAD+ kinase